MTEDYGIDWTGPVSLDDDNTVVLDDLADVLSDTEKATLSDQIPQLTTLTEDWMIQSFTIAKVFVHEAATD